MQDIRGRCGSPGFVLDDGCALYVSDLMRELFLRHFRFYPVTLNEFRQYAIVVLFLVFNRLFPHDYLLLSGRAGDARYWPIKNNSNASDTPAMHKNIFVPPGNSCHSFPVYFLTISHPSDCITIAAYMTAIKSDFIVCSLKIKKEAGT